MNLIPVLGGLWINSAQTARTRIPWYFTQPITELGKISIRMPDKIAADAKNHDILGGLDLMATFASIAGVKLPENDREGKPIIFDIP